MHQRIDRSTQLIHDYFLHDPQLITSIDLNFFSPDFWREKGQLSAQAQGRGNTYAFTHGSRQFFLRHYRRGGALAPLLRDVYIWTGLQLSRAWREFTLLQKMHAQGLPVPRPAAAHVRRIGALYRADIVTERIEKAVPLSSLVTRNDPVDPDLWIRIGKCLGRFHSLGIVHADLNAHNILIDNKNHLWLIDFDKSFWKSPNAGRQEANLRRLRRSLDKVWPIDEDPRTRDRAWALLLRGYGRH